MTVSATLPFSLQVLVHFKAFIGTLDFNVHLTLKRTNDACSVTRSRADVLTSDH